MSPTMFVRLPEQATTQVDALFLRFGNMWHSQLVLLAHNSEGHDRDLDILPFSIYPKSLTSSNSKTVGNLAICIMAELLDLFDLLGSRSSSYSRLRDESISIWRSTFSPYHCTTFLSRNYFGTLSPFLS